MIKTVKELKEFRISHKLSQRDLAKFTGISRNSIAMWEHRGSISEEGLLKINRALFPLQNDVVKSKNKNCLWGGLHCFLSLISKCRPTHKKGK